MAKSKTPVTDTQTATTDIRFKVSVTQSQAMVLVKALGRLPRRDSEAMEDVIRQLLSQAMTHAAESEQ